MDTFFINLKINPCLYSRDPLQTDLGKKIIAASVDLIDEIGLEPFTFKKLATAIGSTEASIYRYFDNKHQLFVYLLNWFWEWMAIRIDLNILNLSDPATPFRHWTISLITPFLSLDLSWVMMAFIFISSKSYSIAARPP